MSIDMTQFHGVFFDESEEHLDEMEHTLMELNIDEPDAEELNSIFRAAHSIKGGSAIFGFEALTGLTHVMENLLDKARKGQTSLTTPIVDILLSTVDLLKSVLQSYRNEEEIDQHALQQGAAALDKVLGQNNTESLTQTIDVEEGFGFFTDENDEIPKEDDSFGFFDDIPKREAEFTNTLSAEDDDGFGFFEPLPEVEQEQVVDTQIEATPPEQKVEIESQEQVIKSAKVKSTKNKTQVAANKESNSIRVDTTKIDSLVNLVGELVITQSMIKIVGNEVQGTVEEKLQGALGELSRNIREIQEAVMSMRMLPMSFAFNRFPRVVRDLAAKLEKKVELLIEGGNTEIDKGLIEKLVDPLTHLVRNSIDHGIEQPAIRVAANKPETGTVVLKAEQRGGSIIISITDDGAGLNRERILHKAMDSGLDVNEAMPDSQVWNLIFAAGFSTAEKVTDVSGRGVGMDVVRRNIESIGGNVEIKSEYGLGSTINIRLPLTLAILDGMCVETDNQVFVIPLTNIIESMQPEPSQVKSLVKDKLLWVRETYWPIVSLHDAMNVVGTQPDPTKGIVVLIETSSSRFGLLVDALVGQQQVVIKSLEQHYKRVPGIAGATIMGDGSVALILDVDSLAAKVPDILPVDEVKIVTTA